MSTAKDNTATIAVIAMCLTTAAHEAFGHGGANAFWFTAATMLYIALTLGRDWTRHGPFAQCVRRRYIEPISAAALARINFHHA